MDGLPAHIDETQLRTLYAAIGARPQIGSTNAFEHDEHDMVLFHDFRSDGTIPTATVLEDIEMAENINRLWDRPISVPFRAALEAL